MTRSNKLLILGVAVIVVSLLVGAVAVLGGGSEPITVADPDRAADVAATTEGDEDAEDAGDTGEDATVGSTFEDTARLELPLTIPAGTEAVSVTASYEGAVAAIPAPGDAVNLYGVFGNGVPVEYLDQETLDQHDEDPERFPLPSRAVVRMYSAVEVLGVTGAEPGAAGGQVTMVVALDAEQAERVVYMAALEDVFFTLVRGDHEATAGTTRTAPNVLEGLDVELEQG